MGMNAEIRSEVKRFVEEKGIAITAEFLECGGRRYTLEAPNSRIMEFAHFADLVSHLIAALVATGQSVLNARGRAQYYGGYLNAIAHELNIR